MENGKEAYTLHKTNPNILSDSYNAREAFEISTMK